MDIVRPPVPWEEFFEKFKYADGYKFSLQYAADEDYTMLVVSKVDTQPRDPEGELYRWTLFSHLGDYKGHATLLSQQSDILLAIMEFEIQDARRRFCYDGTWPFAETPNS